MTTPKRKRPKKITATKPDFVLDKVGTGEGAQAYVRQMGVPCVDLNIERRTPTPRLRYYVAKALLAIARTLRHLAYRIAS